MISAIVCVDENWGIGYKGKLLTHISEDMRFFREKTINSVVIMGRRTYDSLSSKPLPYRTNIVVTSKVDKPCEISDNNTIFATMDFVKAFLSSISTDNPMRYHIIGGGQIYNELLPFCDIAYVTKVDYRFKHVDTYFPNLDKIQDWEVWYEEASKEKESNGAEYKFCIYKKV